MRLQRNQNTPSKIDNGKKNIVYPYSYVLKRTLDIFISLIGLFLSLPILFISILAIKIEGNGPVFFIQERSGYKGKAFKIIKLRTMITNAETIKVLHTRKNDPRITKVGTYLRRRRIDEVPQFINVLKGEMSIVGPRPEVIEISKKLECDIPNYSKRFLVKPGITGWAQVNGGYDITIEEKIKLDLQYIQHQSILFDVEILIKTIWVVVTGKGAR